jgi:hypothetical protein
LFIDHRKADGRPRSLTKTAAAPSSDAYHDLRDLSDPFRPYVGEAVFGAALLAFAPYRRQFIATLRSNTAALMAITGANELINIGGGLGTRYALLLAPLGIVQAVGSTTTLFVFAIGALLSLLFPALARESLSGTDLTQNGIAAIVVSVGVWLAC